MNAWQCDQVANTAISKVEKAVPIILSFNIKKEDEQYRVTVNSRYDASIWRLKNGKEKQQESNIRKVAEFVFTKAELSRLCFVRRDGSKLTIADASLFEIPNLLRCASNGYERLDRAIQETLQNNLRLAFADKGLNRASAQEIYNEALETLGSRRIMRLMEKEAFYRAFVKMVNEPLRW